MVPVSFLFDCNHSIDESLRQSYYQHHQRTADKASRTTKLNRSPNSSVETFTYVPMLGAGGSYLSFVTGNISNLKLPVALNALEQADVKVNSEEGEIISTVAIAVSSIVTTLIIILGVLLITPLTPVLNAPVLEPAFAQILPALFGGLGVVFISKNWKISVAPIILMLALFIAIPTLNAGTVGIMVPVGVLFTLAVSRVMYTKNML